MRALVLLNLLNALQKKIIKCSTSLAFYLFSQTCLIKSTKHEHSCKVLFLFFFVYFAKLIIVLVKKIPEHPVPTYTVVPAKSDSDVMFCLQSY